MKLIVIGHGRHGKDTVCKLLQKNHGVKFVSSSLFCTKKIVYPVLSEFYLDEKACYDDRHNHRKLWYELINFYNYWDPTKLVRGVFDEGNVYCGLRNVEHLNAAKEAKIVHHVIWVDRSEHQPPEFIESCSVGAMDANYVLNNNGTLEELELAVHKMVKHLVDVNTPLCYDKPNMEMYSD